MESKIELIEPEEVKQARVDRYHRHLEKCKQCRDNPFNQCPAGVLMLKAAAGYKENPPPPRPDVDIVASLINMITSTKARQQRRYDDER